MGERGPAPKRSGQRRRENLPDRPTVGAVGAPVVEVPDPDPTWHPIALRLFESLRRSGQARFFEPSDWAAAELLCESMSRELNPQPVIDKDGGVVFVSFPPKAASMTAWRSQMASLNVTDNDRRRVSLELERPKDEGAGSVELLADARLRLAGPG